MTCGIYKIGIGGRIYIGQSCDIIKRISQHLRRLKLGKHENPHMQNAYLREGSMEFSVVLVCLPDDLTFYEQAILNFYISIMNEDSILNIHRECVGSSRGTKLSLNARLKISVAKKGKPGRVWTDEQKNRLSRSKIGIKRTPESIAIFVSKMKGRKHTEETKAKMSASRKGRKMSDQARKNMSAAAIIRYQKTSSPFYGETK